MMAMDLHSRELLLPSQFLFEEDNSFTKKNLFNPSEGRWSAPSESTLSSPAESELCSTETTETDGADDDYVAELTRHMTQYMLQDDDDDDNSQDRDIQSIAPQKSDKIWGLSGSPQSTLWSPLGSSQERPYGSSNEPSPPVTPIIEDDSARDSPYDFLGDLENINGAKFQHSQNPNCITVPSENQNIGFQSIQDRFGYQVEDLEFHKLKQEQFMKREGSLSWGRSKTELTHHSEPNQHLMKFQNKCTSGGMSGNGGRAHIHQELSSNTWPTLKQEADSGWGMRAVFLNGSGSGRGSCGTGVFLPRGVGYSFESRKKQGCSTVLIPARVAHALKLHSDKMGSQSRSNLGGFVMQQDALVGEQNGMYNYSLQKIDSGTERPAAMTQNIEMGLPQEWTY